MPSFELVPGFSTSLKPETVSKMGGVMTWETLYDANDIHPRFHDQTFTLSEVTIFGEKSRATVQFYNQVLMEVCIYSSTHEGVLRVRTALASQYSVDLEDLEDGGGSGSVELIAGEDPEGAPFSCAAVQDVKTDFYRWIRHYT